GHLGPRHPPQAHDLLPTDFPLAGLEEGLSRLPAPGPPAALAGRGELLTPFGLRSPLPPGSVLGRQGAERGIVSQSCEERDAGRLILGPDQWSDDTAQGIAAVG